MKNMTILVDANVILDYVASREPYFQEAYKVMELCYIKKVHGYLAFHSVSIIWYTLRKFIPDSADRRLWMKRILQIVRVAGASHEEVLKAIEMDEFRDFEDCLQDRCAEAVRTQYIVTSNVKDFKESTIPAIKPLNFCKLMETRICMEADYE